MKRVNSDMTMSELIRQAQEISDIVKVSSKQVEQYIESGEDSTHYLSEIVLNEFTAIVDEKIVIFYVHETSSSLIAVSVFDMEGVEVGYFEWADNREIIPVNDKADSDKTKGAMFYAGTIYRLIQKRLSEFSDSFEIEERRVRKKSPGKKTSRKGGRKVRMLKTYTLVRDTPIRINRSHGKITCPCWGVRGHYRHYKSGKVVFIAAYQKGKDRSHYTPKEYVVFRKESKNENH